MGSTFGGLEISKRSLFAHQAALATTGHNIANANTRGYTRQTVNLVASRPLENPGLQRSNTPGQTGTGVEFDSITRIREGFLDHQFYNENKSHGEWSVRKDTLEKLEAIVNEPSDSGIRQVIENFWNSWQDLNNEPDNLTARAVVKERSLALTDSFNHTSRQLRDLSADLTENIRVKVSEANTIISQVARLNSQIYRIEGLGDTANDLRDQRDVLIDDLSKIINVTVREDSRGYNVDMGSIQLVNGTNVTNSFTEESIKESFTDGDLNSGEAYGMFLARDQYVANYQLQLDAMVKAVVDGDVKVKFTKGTMMPEGVAIDGTTYTGAGRVLTEDKEFTLKGINGLHQLGYTLQDPLQSGGLFFTVKSGYSGLTAESITLNEDIVANVKNIASSTRTYVDSDGSEKVLQGNGELALHIAGLRNQKFNFDPGNTGLPILSGGSFGEFFRAVVGQLGVQTQEAAREEANQKILVEQVDSRRQSVSGVSLDEEMANMIKYQHAYNAAARSLTTFDEMLDKVINGMGVVGR